MNPVNKQVLNCWILLGKNHPELKIAYWPECQTLNSHSLTKNDHR